MNRNITVTMAIEEYERLKQLEKTVNVDEIFDKIGAIFGKAKTVIKNQERYIANTDALVTILEDVAIEVRKIRDKKE